MNDAVGAIRLICHEGVCVLTKHAGFGYTKSTNAVQGAEFPVLRSDRERQILVKSIIDRLSAVVLLILLAPLMAVIALAILINSRGPVLFRQTRVGLHNRPFTCFKFRSMRWEPTPRHELRQTARNDDRITSVGRILRRTSMDELPQLFNLLRGDMSLVGPRPHAPTMRTEGLLCDEAFPHYDLRHRLKPGITGLAQVNGLRGATETIFQLRQRLELDLYYVENWNLMMDLSIIAMTPVRLFVDENAY